MTNREQRFVERLMLDLSTGKRVFFSKRLCRKFQDMVKRTNGTIVKMGVQFDGRFRRHYLYR